MSQENVEIVLRHWNLWNEGDLDGWARFFDPDVVVAAPEGWPEGTVSEGIDAWRLQAERLRNTWKEARAVVDAIRSVGENRVLAEIRYVTRGDDPNISFNTPMAVVITLDEGTITREDYFWGLEQALEAVALSE